MAREVALSPSQVKKDGQWQPIGQKTPPVPRPYSPNSLTRRLSSATAKLKRKPLPTIKESPIPSLKSNSSISLGIRTPLPPVWSHSSEHLMYIHPSRQLHEFQNASSVCACYEASSPTPALLRTQSQWRAQQPASYAPSGQPVTEGLSDIETSASSDPNFDDSEEHEHDLGPVGRHTSREAIADLFQRVETYEREHPAQIKDAGKVWVRVSEVGHDLTKTFKTMGSLRRKSTFEARLERNSTSIRSTPFHNVPARSQLRLYEKPTRMKRISIKVKDCWTRFRNWSTGRDTDLEAGSYYYQTMNVSIVSFDLNEVNDTSVQHPRQQPRTRSRTSQRTRRRDSKFTVDDSVGRRKPSLFPDADNGFVAVDAVAHGSRYGSARRTRGVNHSW